MEEKLTLNLKKQKKTEETTDETFDKKSEKTEENKQAVLLAQTEENK